jgi:flagellar hook-associated protein 1
MVLENLNLGLTALRASQLAMDIIGHNIANVNTPGYTRQRADLVTSQPQFHYPGQLGTGVMVEQIVRLNDSFTQLQLENENSNLSKYTIQRQIYDELEGIFNEPSDLGLQKTLSDFFAAWQTLASNPEDYGARAVVVERARGLATFINSMNTQLSAIKSQIDDSISLEIGNINELTSEIAKLNDNISKAESGGIQNANDLRDRRDYLVIELNKIIDVRVRENENKTLLIETNGAVLVAGVYSYDLTTGVDESGHIVPVASGSGAQVVPEGGKLKGYLDVRDSAVDDIITKLNDMAKSLVEEVNRVHSQGTPLVMQTRVVSEKGLVSSGQNLNSLDWDFAPKNGSFYISVFDSNGSLSDLQEITVDPFADTLEDIRDRINAAFPGGAVQASINGANQLIIESAGGSSFSLVNDTTGQGDTSDFLLGMGINNFFTGSSAATIAVADTIQADYSLIAASKSNSPGDNSNALDIAALQSKLVFQNGTSTFEDYYKSWVSNVGTLSSEAQKSEDISQSIVQLLEERMAQAAGVSIDEEATNLIRFQRAYQAAAKIITTANSLFDTLLSM